jgi:hypothetical protein
MLVWAYAGSYEVLSSNLRNMSGNVGEKGGAARDSSNYKGNSRLLLRLFCGS